MPIKVTTLTDIVDAADGLTSLREAVAAAEDGDEIYFADGLSGRLTLVQGAISIDMALTISGDTNDDGRADVTISADNRSRIFDITATSAQPPSDDEPVKPDDLSKVSLRSLTLTEGRADSGGAIRAADENVLLILANTTVSASVATGNGGTGVSGGGAVLASNLYASNVTLSGNATTTIGGGLHLTGGPLVSRLTNVTIAENVAGVSGGGIHFADTTAAFYSTTISTNVSNRYGGGLSSSGQSYIGFSNSVIAQNEAGLGAADLIDSEQGSQLLLRSSFIGTDANAAGFASLDTDLSVINDGGDAALGVLTDHGGPVSTMTPLAGSQLVDAGSWSDGLDFGDSDSDGNRLERIQTDAAGRDRRVDEPDIGAGELQHILVTTLDDVVDSEDGKTSLREALAQGGGNGIGFDPSLAGGTLVLTQGVLQIGSDVIISGDTNGDGRADITISGDVNGDGEANVGDTELFSVVAETLRLEALTLGSGYSATTGGAVFVAKSGTAELVGITFAGNSTAQRGGAIYVQGTLRGVNLTFKDNEAASYGGAIYARPSSSLYLANATFSENRSIEAAGGALSAVSASVSLWHTTFTGNSAATGGGAMEFYGASSVTLENSVIADNTSAGATSTILDSGTAARLGTARSNVLDAGVEIDPDRDENEVSPLVVGLRDGTGGNIVVKEIDPELSELGDYGGVVDTQSVRLRSILHDAADPDALPRDFLDLDSDGDTTEVLAFAPGGPRNFGGGADIGAHESALSTLDIVVDTLVDEVDGDYSTGNLSLREAIDLAPEGATISFAQGLAGTVTLTGGALVTARDLTINGDVDGDHKADVVLSGNDASRVIDVVAGKLTIASLTISNGVADIGGGIRVSTDGRLSVLNSTVTGNTATADSSGSPSATASGGGIHTRGALTVVNSTIAGNSAALTGTDGFGFATGGGIAIEGADATLVNATVFGNSASASDPLDIVRGGGLYTFGAGLLVINHSTIVDNSLSGTSENNAIGRGLYSGGNASLTGSIITGNFGLAGGTYLGRADYVGANIIGNNAFLDGVAGASVELSDVFADVADGRTDLSNYGGPVDTVALQRGGAAEDSGDPNTILEIGQDTNGDGTANLVLPVDARLENRLVSGRPDLGAFEIQSEAITGTDEADEMVEGTAAAERIMGLRGDDLVVAGTGDTAYGGAGNDTLFSAGGSSFGNSGSDTVIGSGLADVIFGGTGVDTARYANSASAIALDLASGGTAGNATGDLYDSVENVFGSAQGDTITGDGNANTLDGFSGTDTLNGAGGDDVLIGGLDADSLIGGTGSDTASYEGSNGGVNVGIFRIGTGGHSQGDSMTGIERLVGSGFGDTLVGANTQDASPLRAGSATMSCSTSTGAGTLYGGDQFDMCWWAAARR